MNAIGQQLRPFTDTQLQQLVDAAADRGQATLRLPAGRYQMHDSLRLRSNLHLVAEGDVILEKVPSVSSPLIDIVGYGHSEFRVADPDLFRPGMGVSISAGNTGGFGTTVARIVDQDGDTFFIDTPFHRDYRPREKAVASSMFPIIAGYGVENVRLSGLILDGGENDSGYLDGCRGGGVFLLGCGQIEMDNLEIRRYRGDAISFQQCVDVWVIACHLHHNAGHGLHPGSGSVRYVMADNHVHDNGGCGIYYCLRTSHSICRDNRIETNAAEGITIGERDTDHLVQANIIRHNGKAGLALRTPQAGGPDRLIIRDNHLSGNQRAADGCEMEIGPRINQVHVLDNQFDGDRLIRIAEDCQDILLDGNTCNGRSLTERDVASASAIQWGSPAQPLPVGPAALPMDGARHLRIRRLATWQDRWAGIRSTTNPSPQADEQLANALTTG